MGSSNKSRSIFRRLSILSICALFAGTLIISDSFTYDAYAKGGSRSSSSRSSSRSSGGGFSKSTTASKPAAKPSNTTRNSDGTAGKSGWGSSKSSTATGKSAADQKQTTNAKRTGTNYKTRDAAMKDYKAKNPDPKKSFNTFKSEPTTRPSYIPQNHTLSDGRSVSINYNPTHGGYGYMDPITGAFVGAMMINSISNAAYASNMANSGYHYPGSPGYTPRSNTMFIVLGVFGIIFMLAIVVVMFRQ